MLKEFPDEIKELRTKYKEKYNQNPRGWNFSEETLEDYEKYLEKELIKEIN